MRNIVNINQLLGTSISLRSDADKLRPEMEGKEHIVLDFAGVTFVSRSFMDALYGLLQEHPGTTLQGLSAEVASTWTAVEQTHRKGRRITLKASFHIRCEDMQEVEQMFNSF